MEISHKARAHQLLQARLRSLTGKKRRSIWRKMTLLKRKRQSRRFPTESDQMVL
ncbi:hypothetical protein PAMP_007663 [Pampus punctatissimus]